MLSPYGRFHATARGVNRCLIYLDDDDRLPFMHSLRRLTLEYELSCPAFCMMPNHFHAIFEGARDAMSRLMHRLNGVHAQRFNERHDRSGHLFQSRFHAREIQDDEQFGRAIDYVWANPVRAGLCAEPHDWRWSGQVLRPRCGARCRSEPRPEGCDPRRRRVLCPESGVTRR